MKPVRHLVLLAALLLAAACSMRGALDALTSEQDRAFAREMVTRLRSGDQDWLSRHFAAQLWAESGKQLGAVPALYPAETGETELVGFNVSSNVSGGVTRRSKEFTLVTHGGGRWTVTHFRTYSDGGPDRVVQWSVVPHSTPPPELAFIEGWDAALPWIWGMLAATLLGIAGLVFWLVRRSRRRRDPLAGQERPSR